MPILYLLLSLSFSAHAEIFQWLDEKGNKHFSDKPHQGATTFQITEEYTYYQIKKVYDGDTVLLTNGKKVRFLGINTPEVEGRNKSVQAGGNEAKEWLVLALKNKKIRLEKDVEKKDKYGRLLAHIFTEDNAHINLELVKKGLASVNIYPPSLKYTKELLEAEQLAEQHNLGIWGVDEYKPVQFSEINKANAKGWHRVLGKVKKIRHARKNSYIDLSKNFSLKIKNKSLSLFPKLEDYLGKEIEVRGWIGKRKNSYSMFIRHPNVIKLLPK